MPERIENIEKYNKDKIKEVDEHNRRVKERLAQKMQEDIDYRAKEVIRTLKRSSVYFSLEEKRYEEIFNKK